MYFYMCIHVYISLVQLLYLQKRPWLASPDTPLRGVVIWPEQETMEAAITLYKVREGGREREVVLVTRGKGGREVCM